MLQRLVGNYATARLLRAGYENGRQAGSAAPRIQRASEKAPPSARSDRFHSNLPVLSDVNQRVIQRTIWEWNDAERRWNVYEATANREEPPYQGKAGDFHDNERTLGKVDLNREEAARASEIIARGRHAASTMDSAMSISSPTMEVTHRPSAATSQPAVVDPFAGLTMVEILKLAFAKSGVTKTLQKDASLFNLLLDIGSQEIKEMNLDAKVIKLPEFHRNALAYTSCHNTASKLLLRMSTTPGNRGEFSGKDKEAAKIALDNHWMAAIAQGLGNAIAQDVANSQRAIYEVHCGGHGFAIIVRNRQIEIVQSFANAVSLVERMERGPLLVDPAIIKQLTAGLASASVNERNGAAQFIAQCNADVFGLLPDPNSWQYRWRRNELKSDAVILAEFTADIKAAFKEVKGILTL